MAPEHRMRGFRPSVAASLTLGMLALAFSVLAAWQWQRATDKQALQDRFGDQAVPAENALPSDPERLTRVALQGRYDGRRLFLVDNRVLAGRAGVHVLDPFSPQAGGPLLLVNRGWAPLPPDRSSLPDIPAVTGTVSVSGFLDHVRQPGLTLGDVQRLDTGTWPQLVTYPDNRELGRALGAALYPMTLYLDPGAAGALQGLDWDPFPMKAERHRGYALTWATLMLACFIAWAIVGRQRAREAAP